MSNHRIELQLDNARHHKQYNVWIEQLTNGCTVRFAYGAIGSALREGTKTATPVSQAKALEIAQKLITEKTDKPCDCCGGVYVIVSEATPSPPAAAAPRVASVAQGATPDASPLTFTPELLEPLPAEAAVRFVSNSSYGMMKKFDGVRMAVALDGQQAFAFNRLGKRVPIQPHVASELRKVASLERISVLMLDGEYLNNQFVAFDLLWYSWNCQPLPFLERWEMLNRVLRQSTIVVANLYTTAAQKRQAIEVEHQTNGEGVVWKRLDAAYMPGRQGRNFKTKFWKAATVRIAKKQKTTNHHSFGMEVLKDGTWVYCGSCTCKGPLPAIGSYREVKYLYVAVGGHLYQPEDWGMRTDVIDADCKWEVLKFKQHKEHAL